MFKNTREKSSIEIIFPIVLFLIFTIGALFIILYAARTYQNIVEGSENNYNSGTLSAYISQKVHSYDTNGNVYIGTFDGIDALILEEEIDKTAYVTYIYQYNGKLRELFTAKGGSSFTPETGMSLFDMTSFKPEFIDDNLLSVYVETDAGSFTQYISTVSIESSEVTP